MAYFDSVNLAMTVHKVARRRLPCEVGHAIQRQYPGARRTWVYYHRWIAWPVGTLRTDGERSPTLGKCVLCGKTPREILDPPLPERRPKRMPDISSDSFLRAAIESGR